MQKKKEKQLYTVVSSITAACQKGKRKGRSPHVNCGLRKRLSDTVSIRPILSHCSCVPKSDFYILCKIDNQWKVDI